MYLFFSFEEVVFFFYVRVRFFFLVDDYFVSFV